MARKNPLHPRRRVVTSKFAGCDTFKYELACGHTTTRCVSRYERGTARVVPAQTCTCYDCPAIAAEQGDT